MFCPRCRVHFSGSVGGHTCPYCGGTAEGSNGSPAPAKVDAKPVSSADASASRTRTEPPHEDRWAPGSLVAGKYEIVSCLGSGGFGTVYKVRHSVRRKYYALKTPHPELARDESFRRRFEREIEAMERFVHADAVMIRDSGITGDLRPYYTMDFVEGESLKTVLRRVGRMTPERAVRLIGRVLKVLEVAHSNQIIHRDVKPENILLTTTGGREAVKVLDFGVAKLLDLVSDSASITRGHRVGTPKYMSPEQITGDPVDARSDIFSTGIMLYEMVTGRHPFAQWNDPIRVTAAILNREPAPPRDLEPELPRALNEIILSMIEKKPKHRPSSAAVLLKDLSSLPECSSRSEPIDPIGLLADVPRARAVSMALREATSAGERRIFLSFGARIVFGRSNDLEKGIRNDWILRCLPCRSAAMDPDCWQRNLTISKHVGSIAIDGAAVVIEPSPDSKHGIVVGGVRSHRPARIQADRFHVAIGERALELDGVRVLRATESAELDLKCLERGRPSGFEAPGEIGYSNKSCAIDSVSFLRVSNWPLHEYHLVWRALTIGSSANASVRIRGKGVEGVHAAVLLESGEAFLIAHAPGVRFGMGGAIHGDGEPERVLPPRKLLPLVAGLEIMIGECRLRLDEAAEPLFKTT